MVRSGRRGFLAAVVTALAILVAPLPALALFAINIEAPGGPAVYSAPGGKTVFDNELLLGVPVDLNPASNQILLVAGVSAGLPLVTGFDFSLGSALSNSPGGPAPSLLSLTWSVETDTAGPSAIQITTSSTGYTLPPSGTASALISAVGGSFGGTPASGSVTAQQWVDLGNGLFVTVGPFVFTPGAQGPFPSPTAFSNTASVGFTSGTPYSITDRVNLSLGGVGATTGGTLSSTVVPEPVTMFLGGTGLLMLTYAARKRLFGR